MDLRGTGWLCVAGIAAALATACSAPKPSARNVLLITIDTLRADALGIYGSQSGASPHLDRLAQRGVVFEQAQSACPNTLPSHSTILTGLYPYHHRVRENGADKLTDSFVTLPERMRDAGYATGAEVAAAVLNHPSGISQGFTQFVDMSSPGVVRQQIVVGDDGSLHDPSTLSAAERDRLKTVSVESRGAAQITRGGVAFMNAHRDGPFFLWLHYYDPHYPYAPPAPFAKRFRDPYVGEVASTDESVAMVLDELARLGLSDNTLVVVAADHGESRGDHGESHHSYLVYQSTMHVPLWFVGPHVPAGRRVATPVSLADVTPTILAWAGLAPDPASDGISLLPAFDGGDLPSRGLYGEALSLARMANVSPLRAWRKGPWKLIHKPIAELYDLDTDPTETENLAGREGALVTEMRAEMGRLAAVGPQAPGASAELDDQTRQQLASLGYVVSGAQNTDDDTMELFGDDANALMGRISPIVDAIEATQFVDVQQTADTLERFSLEFPDNPGLIETLLDIQLRAGRAEKAIATLRRGIEVKPDRHRFWSNLGELLLRVGRNQEAKNTLTEALVRYPCDLPILTNLAKAHSNLGARAAQIAVLEQGVEKCGAPPELMNDLAYRLATARQPKLRNGGRALELAEKMIGSLGQNPLALDTVAVAQAEVGRHAEARATLARAIDMAKAQRLPEEALHVLEDHAATIAAGKPIRD